MFEATIKLEGDLPTCHIVGRKADELIMPEVPDWVNLYEV